MSDEAPTEMTVSIDYGDGSPPETLEVTDGFMSFHPYTDEVKHTVTVEDVTESVAPQSRSAPPPEEPAPDEYDPNAPDEDYQLEVGYDPAAHTVTEVIGYVEDNPDQLDGILAAEEAGKARTTLISHLESMRP